MGTDSPALTGKQRRAVLLVAEDEIGDREIATAVGIGVSTLERWKQRPEFRAAVTEHIDALSRDLSRYAIARKDRRVAEYQRRWEALQSVRAERAADPSMEGVPGAGSGLILRTYKQVGAGEAAQILPEYSVDTPTLSAQAALEKQAAQEVGQWSEKSEMKAEQHVSFTITFDRADD